MRACPLFPSGHLFVGGIGAISTCVQDLWVFSSLGRDTVRFGDSRYVHVIFSEQTQSAFAVSQMFFGQ